MQIQVINKKFLVMTTYVYIVRNYIPSSQVSVNSKYFHVALLLNHNIFVDTRCQIVNSLIIEINHFHTS